MKRLITAVAALFAVLFAAPAAQAWTDPAHRTVAEIAYARLTPQAKAAVDALVAIAPAAGEPSCPVASLADAAVFVDCVDGVRRYNDLRRLHFEETPMCGAADPNSYCRNGQCVSEAVKRAAAVLADPAAPADAKLFALEQLAHFIADMHQPYQMVDNRDDRGADVRVSLPGSSDRRLNLHMVWEETLPALAVGSGELGARFIGPLAGDNETAWSRGGIDAWAVETRELARSLYQRLPEPPECGRRPRNPAVLTRAYVQSGVTTTREQIAKAGVRLAAVLNATLR